MDARLQTLATLYRAAPTRTTLFTFLPLLLAAALVVNGFAFGASLSIALPAAAALVAYAAMTTRYHIASLRRRRITAFAIAAEADDRE
ncbi:hypothetical protein ACFQDG_06590 [Natronoarchaeum mannanilyticum]|uniref:Uncharacterized protein n=1 Tax=Natronoarchaeum mannanilyticum TaxID=926360 RepID=A0AAV3T568_9EURY